MRFSDNALLLISTVLENEGFSATDTEIAAALTDMFEGKRPSAKPVKVEPEILQPGECIVVMNHHDNEYEVFDDLASAKKAVAEFLEQRSNPEDYTSDIDVHISRKKLDIGVTTTVTFE